MAAHIDTIRNSGIPERSKAEFYAACRPGMPLFCQGRYPISLGIEKFTGSPFSHIATLFYVDAVKRWAVLEATKEHGVHVGHLDYYIEQYKGDLVLASTPALNDADYSALLQAQFDLVDDAYDTGQEISMIGHKLLHLPIRVDRKEFFCSGLYEQGRKSTSVPLEYKGPGMATPEQVWRDPSIVPVCALVKSS
ncbi:MAG TPA: hypothetical protein VGR96_15740 [Acidobacteriaceae bacterium]|nr:hypothetical protein [Acidobacteriaceae bacterium]